MADRVAHSFFVTATIRRRQGIIAFTLVVLYCFTTMAPLLPNQFLGVFAYRKDDIYWPMLAMKAQQYYLCRIMEYGIIFKSMGLLANALSTTPSCITCGICKGSPLQWL